MNIEKLLAAAFDFGQHLSSSSIADQTKGSGQSRQENYEDTLDTILDIRTKLAEIRRENPLCYEILKLRFGLDKETQKISEVLEVSPEDVKSLIESALLYLSEKSNQIPRLTQKYTMPKRSDLVPGTSVGILTGTLKGTSGDFLLFEGNLQDRLIIRYFVKGQENITIQNISDVDWL